MNKVYLSGNISSSKVHFEQLTCLIISLLFIPAFSVKASHNLYDKSFVNSSTNERILSETHVTPSLDKEESIAIQQRKKEITGTITDVQGEPIIGANIIENDEINNGTVTDINGNFKLQVRENSVIHISYIGYLDQDINTAGRNIFNITLQEDTKALEEVVVVGYGTQKKVNLTGSVASITSKDLSKAPTPNVSTLLYGKLPGLITYQRSGEPGLDDVSLSIRGFSNALIVVDGVVGRNFTRLDPNEIESVTILKDAASAAVYGVSGGNGVILVTTKKGNIGKPMFNYSMNYGVQAVTKYPKFVTSEEYAILKNEAAINLGGEPIYTREEIEKFRLGSDPDYPNFDYYDYMVRDYPPQFQQNISVSGGSEKIKYFFLLGQTTQASMWNGGNQDYAKYNFRSNVNVNISKNFDISVETGARLENRNNLIQDSYLMASWLQYSWPIFAPKNPDGTIAATNYGLTAYLDRDLTGYIKDNRNVYEGILTFNYKIPFVEGLSVNLKAAYDMHHRDRKDWQKKYYAYNWNKEIQASTVASTRGSDQLVLDTWKSVYARVIGSLNYERTFAKLHNVKGLLVYEVNDEDNTNFQASRINYVVPIDQIFAGPDAGKSNTGSASDNGRESYVGRFNYDYAGKYLLEYSFRYDGSAKFPPDKRWGYFAGVSAGWRLSEEDFIKKNFTAIDNFKIRGSWGNLGSDNTGNFQFLAGYTYPSQNYIFGGSAVTSGMVETGTPNPNITWEKSQIYNIGIDLSLWNRLIEFEGEIFYRKREGLLARRTTQLPSTYGATLPFENLNSDDARGFELVVGHNSSIGEVQYHITSNLTWARLMNRHLEQRVFNNQFDNWRNNNENRWNNLYWGYKAIGQFQSVDDIHSSPVQDGRANSTLRPGDIKYDDFNKDGIIDDNDIQIIGRGQVPEISYGLGINVTWKRLSIDMNWQGNSHSNIQEQHFLIQPFANGMNAYSYFMDRWHRADPWNPNSEWIAGKYPSTINDGAPNNKWNSSFWLLDATYMRLKLLAISYSLKNQLFNQWGIDDLTISLSGQNLLTFSNTGPIDPETPSGRLSYYPQQKTYNIGLNITF